jgi:glucose/arabinose dehydrogenase
MGLVALTVILVVAAGYAQQTQRDEPDAPLTEPRIMGNPDQRFRVVPLTGLESPFGFAMLPNGDMLVTEKPGRLRLVRDFTLDPTPISGIPPVLLTRFQGLWDVALHPQFDQNRLIYFTYARKNETEVLVGDAPPAAKAVLGRARYDGGHVLSDVREIFTSNAWISGPTSARIAFGRDGKIFMTIGVTHRDLDHGGTQRVGTPEEAQNPKSHLGKILRLNDDGTAPPDNPFAGRREYAPEIYALGVRNPQGLMLHPDTGEMWEAEHGPQGGDEVNILKPGANYGWPVISLGRAYSGDATLTDSGPELAQPCSPGMEQPLIAWLPSIGPSGMTYYTGDKFPAWKGSLFVGALRGSQLQRVTLNRRMLPTGRESLLTELRHRIRDVKQGADGLLYVMTEGRETDRGSGKGAGTMLRIEPVVDASR